MDTLGVNRISFSVLPPPGLYLPFQSLSLRINESVEKSLDGEGERLYDKHEEDWLRVHYLLKSVEQPRKYTDGED